LARGPGRWPPDPWPAYRAQLGPARALVAVARGARRVARGACSWCRSTWWPGACSWDRGPWGPALVPVAVFVFVCRPVPCLYVRARTYKHPGPRSWDRGRWPWAASPGPRRLGRGRRFARPGAWAKARPPGGPKNGPGASCAGSSPFLRGQWCTKQFLRSSNKGPPVFVERFRLQFICIRGTIGSMKTTCSKCDGPNDRLPQRYCRACHAAYARENRPRHVDLSEEQRKRSVARAYANVYQRRGKLFPEPCAACRDPSAQKHHDDYSKPLQVTWLCRKCHLTLHLNDKTLHVEQL
jgi:hypothetical protein